MALKMIRKYFGLKGKRVSKYIQASKALKRKLEKVINYAKLSYK